MSADINPAIAALAKAQSEMTAVLRDSNNPHFKSKYAGLSSVRESCLPALNANGFAVMQRADLDEAGEYIETMFLHESGESFSTKTRLLIGKPDMQGYGSAITYARRYGLLCLAGLAPEDDDGNAAGNSPAKSAPRKVRDTNTAALGEAWEAGVLDSLPADATARQKAEAFAKRIEADFDVPKTVATIERVWEKRQKIIDGLQQRHPDLYENLIDAFVAARQAITGDDPTAADMLGAG